MAGEKNDSGTKMFQCTLDGFSCSRGDCFHTAAWLERLQRKTVQSGRGKVEQLERFLLL